MSKTSSGVRVGHPDPTTETAVYCGPSIPGVANQYTFYRNGLPPALQDAIKQYPPMGGMVVPLAQLPDVMRELRTGTGHISRLYRLVQANFSKGGN